MKKIPAFRAGTHTDMNGKQLTFNREHLIATANAYNPSSHEAPIVIGHPQTDTPAYGWIERFEVVGDELIAFPVQVEPVFGEMVDAGRFKKISMSFYEPNNPANPKKGVWYPKHVGFLGAMPPAIKGLKPIEFSENDGAIFTAEFADGFDKATGDNSDLMSGLAKGLQAFLLYFASLNPFPKEPEPVPALPFNPQFNEPQKPENSPTEHKETTMTVQTVTTPVTPVTPPMTTPATPAPATPPTTTQAPVTVADPSTVAENEALKKRIADMEQAEQKAKNDSKTAEHVAYAENLVTAGKLPPAQKEVTVAILNQLESGSQTVAFGEGDNAKPLAGEFKTLLDALPVNAMFSESAKKGQAPQSPTVAYGENVSPDRVAEHQRIQTYATTHNVSYAEAAHAVMVG